MDRLNVKALAGGLGVSWALCILLAGWASALGWGERFVEVMSSVYIGYASSFFGGIIGAAWGLIDGALGGAVIAIVYNAISTRG